jgi:hypothetical protein
MAVEGGQAVQSRLHVCFEATVRRLYIHSQVGLVKTENHIAYTYVTVNCEVCRSAIALLPVDPGCECIRYNKSNHPIQNLSHKSLTNPYT